MKGCIPFQNQKYKLALRLPAHQLRDRLRDMGDDVGSERAVFVALFRRQHPRPAEQVRCRRRALEGSDAARQNGAEDAREHVSAAAARQGGAALCVECRALSVGDDARVALQEKCDAQVGGELPRDLHAAGAHLFHRTARQAGKFFEVRGEDDVRAPAQRRGAIARQGVERVGIDDQRPAEMLRQEADDLVQFFRNARAHADGDAVGQLAHPRKRLRVKGKAAERVGLGAQQQFGIFSDAMREKIRSGVWGPGQRLPIRSELVTQYNTTVATLQKAMDELAADGFIISAGKRGTFVANEPPNLSTFAVVFQEAASTAWEDTLWTIFVSQKRRLEKQFDLKFSLYHLEENNMASEDFLRLTADARFQRLAGVIFLECPKSYMTAPLLAAQLPCVAFTRENLPGINTIWADYGGLLRLAFDWLHGEKCSRIAAIANLDLPFDYMIGVAQYAARFGLNIPREWQLGLPLGEAHSQWGENLIRLLMAGTPDKRPDGLIIVNENLWGLVTNTLQRMNIQIGRDIRLALHANLPSTVHSQLGVARFGFDIDALINGCLTELRRFRKTGNIAHDAMVGVVRE